MSIILPPTHHRTRLTFKYHTQRVAIESRDVTKLTAAMRLAEQTEAFDHTESKVIFNKMFKLDLQV